MRRSIPSSRASHSRARTASWPTTSRSSRGWTRWWRRNDIAGDCARGTASRQLKLIHTRHGAGDREGTSDATMALFDLVLLPGRKYADRFVGLGYLRPDQYAITGWPKFEAVRALAPPPRRLFDNDNPIVVYNPHFDQRVGSWARMGRAVLDFFVAHPEYNLVFAPHLVLFRRRWRHRAAVPDRYRRALNILVDTDSPALSDMTYLDAADVIQWHLHSQEKRRGIVDAIFR